jgi:hypothetical protein
MAGIEDLTNMMMTGTRTDVPPVQGPPVATNRVVSGPPEIPSGKKRRRPEAFQSLDELDDFLDFTTDDDLSLQDLISSRSPTQDNMTIDGDATALAQAVVGRTGGDIASARAVLAQADMILSQAGDRRPRMAADGGPLKVVPEDNPGLGKLPEEVRNRMGYKSMGGPLYAAEGRAISDRDTDMLRQMIMDSLANKDQSGRAMSNKDLKETLTVLGRRAGQSGRAMSDKDMSYFYDSRLDVN